MTPGNEEPRLAQLPSLSQAPAHAVVQAVPTVAALLGSAYSDSYKMAFPDVQPPYAPFGYLALVQLRTPHRKIGSIIMTDESVDAELPRSQAALVRALGPACFRDRQTGESWVEGAWFRPGDFIRIPLYGGDRFDVEYKTEVGTRETVRFAFIKEADAIALVTGDPLNIKNS